ncbi:MAG: TolB family protein, partial [Acidobacteriota bacterium]
MRHLGLALVLVACGTHHGSGSGGSLDGLTALAIAPADQTLVIVDGTPAASTYTVTGTFADGHTEDVTADVTLDLADESLGAFSGADFQSTTSHGGRTQVTATAGTIAGSTGLTLMFQQHWNDPGSPGLPPNPGGLFGGPATGVAPALVYPNDGALLPPNLGRLELHFMPGANNTVFALSLKNSLTDITVYLQCTLPMNGGCIYQPDAQLWSWLASTNRGDEPVTWTIAGTDSTGSAVGTSGAMTFAFALQDVTGGIYYWTTTTQAVMRYDFASATQTTATKYLGTELEGTCIGCHALSRDGTKLVAEVNGQNDGRTALVDVASKTVMNSFGSTPKSMFESWNPDGSAYVSVYGDSGATNYNLMIMNGHDATLMTTLDVGGTATHPTDHPDWSLDGQKIAYVQVGTAGTMQRMWNGSIYQVSAVGGTPQLLVGAPDGLHNEYYPTYAPDGRLLVYDESTCTSGNGKGTECNADTNPTATLMAVDSIAGGTPVALANANRPGVADGSTTALTNSFPKWNPFIFQRTASGGHLAWITFSSKRQYGLRTPPGSGTLLWMAAIDLDAPAGSDPSFVAFALPFQDITTSN